MTTATATATTTSRTADPALAAFIARAVAQAREDTTSDLITRRPMTDDEFAARWAEERKAWAPDAATAACQGCGKERPTATLRNVEAWDGTLELLCPRCVAESSDEAGQAAFEERFEAHIQELCSQNCYM